MFHWQVIMLKIVIPAGGASKLTFTKFERLDIAAPADGAEAEANDDLVLRFENETEAVAYANELEVFGTKINDKTTTQYLAISDIIVAIRQDEFVQQFYK